MKCFLQNLGYEKYAGIFEEAKIGMLELPYLSEERLEKLGIPLGPRIRILQVGIFSPQNIIFFFSPQNIIFFSLSQEAKIPYNLDGQNYNVYIL